jgi:hypothetical protein
VLRVAAGKVQTELQCTVIGESDDVLRIRIAELWEVDIYKEMILGVCCDLVCADTILAYEEP